ncbi:uncharacterized protein LOC124479307 isoform X2 [Hypomesus transpacificus]|uniref:uncharacterized protein LOC124479307 isoform X2 n=1 Tax=Hypomesus transpacificus TaxID=137520 RepID=UPI001F077BE4|nr:uncharacterized protein LOC124479307 isoform X2 [Hypomesus transpacificus]
MYYIVEFLEENLVGIVAQCWTYEENEQQYSYWPPSNPTKRAKKQEIPDEELWISRRVRIFAATGDFERALRWSKTAEDKSAVETEEDQPRKKKRPNKFGDSSEDEGSSWEVEPMKKTKRRAKLPTPPRPKKAKISDPFPNPPPPTLATDGTDDELPESQHSMTLTQHFVEDKRPSWPATAWEPRKLQDTLQVLLRKVETIEASQREILLLLRRSQGRQSEEPALNFVAAQCVKDLQDLEERLKMNEFRKRVIHHLSLTGGATPGECVRRVMRSVATNAVWSCYSFKGKREKLPFIGTTVCTTIKQAVMKWKTGLGEEVVEILIGETLKHAPAQTIKAQLVSSVGGV